MFNLGNRVLTDTEIKVLEKVLIFFHSKNNKLAKAKTRFRRFLQNSGFSETKPYPSEMPVFSSKLTWKPSNGHPNLEVFPIQLKNEIFKQPLENLRHSNTSKEEWEAIRALGDDRTIVIKACVRYFLSNFYFSPNDSPSKTMKNVFYFI